MLLLPEDLLFLTARPSSLLALLQFAFVAEGFSVYYYLPYSTFLHTVCTPLALLHVIMGLQGMNFELD
jgi:hypothetical protein